MMLLENILLLQKEIAECALLCQRKPSDIKLLAVTKKVSLDVITTALHSGIELIAESKVQEAVTKIPFLKGLYQEFHFIGHLQSNKISELIELQPSLIHSIDKYSTAEKLNHVLARKGRKIEVLIEVNTSNEDSKNGVTVADCSELIKKIEDLEHVQVKGLMTIGALTPIEARVRNCFRTLREIYEKEKSKTYFSTEMQYLSMGMSNDFKIAIQEGANILRIGSWIFGERN